MGNFHDHYRAFIETRFKTEVANALTLIGYKTPLQASLKNYTEFENNRITEHIIAFSDDGSAEYLLSIVIEANGNGDGISVRATEYSGKYRLRVVDSFLDAHIENTSISTLCGKYQVASPKFSVLFYSTLDLNMEFSGLFWVKEWNNPQWHIMTYAEYLCNDDNIEKVYNAIPLACVIKKATNLHGSVSFEGNKVVIGKKYTLTIKDISHYAMYIGEFLVKMVA